MIAGVGNMLMPSTSRRRETMSWQGTHSNVVRQSTPSGVTTCRAETGNMQARSDQSTDEIQGRADFDFLRYASCWEDADVLIEALRPQAGKRVLSIGAAGDNAFALAATGADVVAADINLAQLACLELKRAALLALDYQDVIAFLGVQDADDRQQTYQKLARQLSDDARCFWDHHPSRINGGIVHQGKFEAYFQLFRTRVLPWIHSKKTISALFQPREDDERFAFWNERWNNWRWRTILRVFFSRFLMGRLGRDPEFFRYVTGSIGDQIQERVQYAMTTLNPAENPFLSYIATGNFSIALPYYLRPENFNRVREGLERLSWYHGTVDAVAQQHAKSGFDAMNLSDIFEYVSEQTAESIYRKLLSHANPSARIAYWNTFVPRRCPLNLRDRVQPLDGLSRELHARDRAFFYSHFQVDEVLATDA